MIVGRKLMDCLYQGSLILTCFMRLSARPVRRAVRRDRRVSGKRRNAAGHALRRTEGREKFATGGVAPLLWYTYHGANRSCPVANFSPVKQVNISDPWYYKSSATSFAQQKTAALGPPFSWSI